MRRMLAGMVLTVGLLAPGCAGPAARIERNRALFESFPPEVQGKVRAGEVDIGFTPEMVVLASGHPDRVTTRRTEAGVTETWSYLSACVLPQRPYRADRYVLFRDPFGAPRHAGVGPGPLILAPDERCETLRVEFRDGRVIAVETVAY